MNPSIVIAIPVLLIGGTEIQTLNFVKTLVSAGYRTTVTCYYEYNSSLVSRMEGTGAKVVLMSLKRSDGILALMANLSKIFKELKPDVVHVQYIAPGLIPIIAARLSGVKRVFATVHQPGRPYGWKSKLLIRIAAQLCDAFFCNSKSVEKSWFGDCQILDPEKIDVMRKHFTIYNGVDSDRIEGIVKQTDKEGLKESLNIKDKKVVGVIGRLREEKGQFILLESIKKVVEEMPDAALLVVGDGADRAYLEQAAVELGVNDHVIWLGQKDPDEVFALYGVIDLVVVPSLFEGFGLTAAEAMTAGKPVVASNVDGLREVIQDGISGLLVPPGNSKALGQAILELLANPAKAASMGERGKKIVETEFSLCRFQSAILATYANYTGARIRRDFL